MEKDTCKQRLQAQCRSSLHCAAPPTLPLSYGSPDPSNCPPRSIERPTPKPELLYNCTKHTSPLNASGGLPPPMPYILVPSPPTPATLLSDSSLIRAFPYHECAGAWPPRQPLFPHPLHILPLPPADNLGCRPSGPGCKLPAHFTSGAAAGIVGLHGWVLRRFPCRPPREWGKNAGGEMLMGLKK